MRMRLGLAALLLSLFSGVLGVGLAKGPASATSGGIPPAEKARRPGPGGKFVVHEWGTFTSFSGSDGVRLEYRPLVDDELPRFVLDRVRYGANPLAKFDLSALQRMETPVAYFYVDQPRDVEVSVAFPRGLLTEFYPPVQAMLPPFQFSQRPALENSLLDWGRFRLLPQAVFDELSERREKDRESLLLPPADLESFPGGKDKSRAELPPVALPAVEGDNHYAFARETDSAIVEIVDKNQRKHYEKFLFYRGLGDFSLPLDFSASGGGRFIVKNDGPDAVRHLFLVQIDGSRVRYCHAPQVAAWGESSLDAPESFSTIDALGDDMASALVDAGLYEKEARAMVKTWRSSWFGETGTRLLYLVPERLTDELLPLEVKPQPDELVRVLVGRMEILAPEESERLLALVDQMGGCLAIEAEPLQSELIRLGRFAEPALNYLARCAEDETRRTALQRLAAALGPTMRGRPRLAIETPQPTLENR